LDLKPFLYHSMLLNYSSLFSPCLLNVTEKLVSELSISHNCVKSNVPFTVFFCGFLHNFGTIRRWFSSYTINSLAQLYELYKSYQYDLGNSTLIRLRKLAAFTLPLNWWCKINELNVINSQGYLVCHRKQHFRQLRSNNQVSP
jgi:hypothetical protein